MNLLFLTHHRRFKITARPGPLARALTSRGHRVTLVCASDRSRARFHVEEDSGIEIVEAPDLLWGRLRSGWDPVSAWRRIRRLRGRRFDLIHAFEARPSVIYPALSVRRALRVPLVMDWVDWWGRGGLISELRPRWYQILFGGVETYYEEHFRSLADQTTVISHALAERARGLGVRPDTIHWIPGGVDTQRFAPRDRAAARAALGLPADALVLAFSAMDVTVDANLVFDAVAQVRQIRRDAILLMAGVPSAALDAAARARGLTAGSGYRHVGLVPHSKLPDTLAAADIGLLPFTHRISNLGRWPNKIGDYMAMGLPTVTNAVGEMKRLTEREPVAVTAAESAQGLARAILELAEDPARRAEMGRRARAFAVREFDWSHIAQRFEDVYRRAGGASP